MSKIRFLEPVAHQGSQLPLLPVRVLGIDLGTTNSSVAEAVWDPSADAAPRAQCLAIEQESVGETVRSSLVPSVVAIINDQSCKPEAFYAVLRVSRAIQCEY